MLVIAPKFSHVDYSQATVEREFSFDHKGELLPILTMSDVEVVLENALEALLTPHLPVLDWFVFDWFVDPETNTGDYVGLAIHTGLIANELNLQNAPNKVRRVAALA